ncbi:hypothetical protein JRQ81_011319 [Phrynocephalus forsythii]|uniref:Uncharacterized protein n=1 Tax=Phrynocephalus forsythii TaxID=171643 RepID=A0A9Q0Y1F1_9SAUR|nr:hypothetical protein JRQ81_011319 [Phrynocephalus forsythii]
MNAPVPMEDFVQDQKLCEQHHCELSVIVTVVTGKPNSGLAAEISFTLQFCTTAWCQPQPVTCQAPVPGPHLYSPKALESESTKGAPEATAGEAGNFQLLITIFNVQTAKEANGMLHLNTQRQQTREGFWNRKELRFNSWRGLHSLYPALKRSSGETSPCSMWEVLRTSQLTLKMAHSFAWKR